MGPPTRRCTRHSTLGVLVKSAWDGGNALKLALRAPCAPTSALYRIRPIIRTARARRPIRPLAGAGATIDCQRHENDENWTEDLVVGEAGVDRACSGQRGGDGRVEMEEREPVAHE